MRCCRSTTATRRKPPCWRKRRPSSPGTSRVRRRASRQCCRVSPRRRLFYEGRLLAMLAEHETAWEAHRQALDLYPDSVVGDRALILLDRAAALVALNEIDAGASLVVDTLARLPAAHRARIFLDKARAVVESVPPQHRGLPAIRDSRDALAQLA